MRNFPEQIFNIPIISYGRAQKRDIHANEIFSWEHDDKLYGGFRGTLSSDKSNIMSSWHIIVGSIHVYIYIQIKIDLPVISQYRFPISYPILGIIYPLSWPVCHIISILFRYRYNVFMYTYVYTVYTHYIPLSHFVSFHSMG